MNAKHALLTRSLVSVAGTQPTFLSRFARKFPFPLRLIARIARKYAEFD